jgi:hypothetical protein
MIFTIWLPLTITIQQTTGQILHHFERRTFIIVSFSDEMLVKKSDAVIVVPRMLAVMMCYLLTFTFYV